MRFLRLYMNALAQVPDRFQAWAENLNRRNESGEFGRWPWQDDYGLWPWQRRK
jgi:hypothetical protein